MRNGPKSNNKNTTGPARSVFYSITEQAKYRKNIIEKNVIENSQHRRTHLHITCVTPSIPRTSPHPGKHALLFVLGIFAHILQVVIEKEDAILHTSTKRVSECLGY